MAGQAQLEIISPSGETRFHDLDPGRGVTNIGRHPDNDVVIDSPGVAAFHAVLDHRRRPYQIMLLGEEGQTTLAGQALRANVFRDVQDWDTIEINGYALIVLEGEEPAREAAPAPSPPTPTAAAPTPAPTPTAAPVGRAALLTDQSDPIILAEISERDWTVDVEQTASCQVTVINGGDIVAAFEVRVEGVPSDWVTIMPAQFNLYEGAQAAVNISFTAPRRTSSRAGQHPLAVVVTSPNYPDHVSRLAAVLTVNPYYEFVVGDLSPKQQTVSWFRRSGQVTLPIQNKGNSDTPFRLEGEDDERGCRFEFQVPGEEAALVRQAEMRLAPDEMHTSQVSITPIKRRLIALRSRHFSFTITTSMVEGTQTARTVMGRLKSTPLIGPWLLLLMLVLLAVLVAFLFRPTSEPILLADTTTPTRNEEVTLNYNTVRFSGLSPSNLFNHGNALFLKLTLEYRTRTGQWQILKSPSELAAPVGLAVHTPPDNGFYRLRVENWLSKLIPWFASTSKELAIFVTPVKPTITEFRSEPDRVWVGEDVIVFWHVADAETLRLEYNGIEETFEGEELESGQRSFTLVQDTVFTLSASNSSWPEEVQKPVRVMVLAHPVPTPVIVRFDVDPLEITAGETVRIDWEVEGADSVTIDPLGAGLPVKGNVGDQPASLTTYQLTAFKTGEDGTQAENKSLLREVLVNPEPSPTPEPVAPEIQLFQTTPQEIVTGDKEEVTLTWSVSGHTTNIEITAPDFVLSGLEAKDSVTVTIDAETLFVLTAYNGELSRSTPAEVTALEPTPTVTPTPPPTPAPTATPEPTPFPPPLIAYYKAEGQAGYESKVVFQDSYQSENGPVYVYRVEAGAWMKLLWEVSSAEVVTLEGYGPQPAQGEFALPGAITQAATYVLTAENNGGQNQIRAFVQVEVTSPPPPPPPFNVAGVEDAGAGTNKVSWSYRPQDRTRIDGFRIYRADVPPGNSFVAVWSLYDPNATEWTDTLAPNQTCGKAYYVVAIYTDVISSEERETAASSTSWFSTPCP